MIRTPSGAIGVLGKLRSGRRGLRRRCVVGAGKNRCEGRDPLVAQETASRERWFRVEAAGGDYGGQARWGRTCQPSRQLPSVFQKSGRAGANLGTLDQAGLSHRGTLFTFQVVTHPHPGMIRDDPRFTGLIAPPIPPIFRPSSTC